MEVIQNESIRSDRSANNALISQAFLRYKQSHDRLPTQEELATETGLSRSTIQRHMKDLDLGEELDLLKIHAPQVLYSVVEKAIQGDVRAIKLYFQIAFNWNEKEPIVKSQEKQQKEVSAMTDAELQTALRGHLHEWLDEPGVLEDYLSSRPEVRKRLTKVISPVVLYLPENGSSPEANS